MLKRALAAMVCLVTMYALGSSAATSWQLQTKLATAGGVMKVRSNPTQTSVGVVVYTNFTTSAAVPVSVAANAGYKISGLTRNGATIPIGNYTSHYSTSFQKSGGATQSLAARFAAQTYTVTAAVQGAGAISPSRITVPYGGAAAFSASPSFGGSFLVSVSAGTVTDLSGMPVSLPCAGPVKITVSNVTGPSSVVASFATVKADAGGEQRVQVNSLVTLDGSASVGGDGQLWSQTGGAPVALAGAESLRPTFTPTSTGTYQFQLTKYIGGVPVASAATQVVVVASLADVMRTDCMGCHASGGVYPAPQVFARWSSSSHKAAGTSCVSCHTDGAMPTPVNSDSVDRATFVIKSATAGAVGENYCAACHNPDVMTAYAASLHSSSGVACASCHLQAPHDPAASVTACNGCHIDASGQVAGHPFPMGASDCTTCHNKHNPGSTSGAMPGALGLLHFNNVTGAGYPASYVTSRASCSDCHFDSPVNVAVRQQWYTSGHARINSQAWMAYDFKTRTGCVQCHTTTGFIAYSTGRVVAAWGVASDKTKEVLTCIGCHLDMTTGVVRTVQPVRPYADDSYVNRDLGVSNICMSCHSGVKNGGSIAAQAANSADFTNLAVITPHYLAAGGVLHGKVGYHFAGAAPYAYYSSNSHRRIGSNDANGSGVSGACVACHKTGENGHTFKVGSGLCANCHGASLSEQTLAQNRSDFDSALTVLAAMLQEKGHPYSQQHPYFSNTNWGSGQAGADTMGAAFNYLLLLKEPGAFAHNSAYAKRLVLDSIDYLYNGAVTGSVDTALDYLLARDRITGDAAGRVRSYQSSGSCATCHANNTGSHTAHLDSGFSCVACHSATASGVASLIPGNATHLNGVVNVEAGMGRSFSYSYAAGGGTCGSISCHNKGSATWGATLACGACHGAPPTGYVLGGGGEFLPNPHTVHAGAAADCNNCHQGAVDSNGSFTGSGHANGMVGVDFNPAVAGAGASWDSQTATCSAISCHSDGTSVSTGVTAGGSMTWNAGDLACAACHGFPPAYPNGAPKANSHAAHNFGCSTCHARTTADGSSISSISRHANHAYDVAPGPGVSFTYVFSATGGACSDISCHNNRAAAWGSTLTCDSCHIEPPGGDQ